MQQYMTVATLSLAARARRLALMIGQPFVRQRPGAVIASCAKQCAVLFSIALASTASAADDYKWTYAGWNGGGNFPNVSFDPFTKGRVYLTSDVAGVYVSTDDGDNWRLATKGLGDVHVAQVEVSRVVPDRLFAATQSGVFSSSDGAKTWHRANDLGGRIKFVRPESYRSIALSAREGDTLCAGTQAGEVFCSGAAGQEWDELHIPPATSPVKAVTALQYLHDEAGLVAARADGIFVYSFATRIWTAGPSNIGKVTDLVVTGSGYAAAADGALWVAGKDAGAWRRMPGQVPGGLYRIDYDAAGNRIFGAWIKGWSGGTVVSRDSGYSWSGTAGDFETNSVENPTRLWANVSGMALSLKVNPHRPDSVMMTDLWAAWRSDDAAGKWVEKIAGAPNTVGSDIRFSPDGNLYVATMDDGLLMSTDRGKSYRPLFPTDGYSEDINGHVWRVDFVEGGRWIATSSPWGAAINQIVLQDGKSFRRSGAGLPKARPTKNAIWDAGYPRALAVDPFDRKKVYLGIDGDDGGGLFVSLDSGETWTRSAGQPASVRIYNGLIADPMQKGTLYWAAVDPANGGVYRSTDAGQTWLRVFTGSMAVFDLHLTAAGTLYATADASGPALFVSRDKGETWQETGRFGSSGSLDAIASDPNNPNVVAVGTLAWNSTAPQQVYLTRNGGADWTDITGDLPDNQGVSAMTFSPDGQELFITRSSDGVYKLSLPKEDPAP